MEENRMNFNTYEEIEEIIEPETERLEVGKIVNCGRLNIRESPNIQSESIMKLAKGSEVMVDIESSTHEFYKIYTEVGIEGYGMKDFIEIQ